MKYQVLSTSGHCVHSSIDREDAENVCDEYNSLNDGHAYWVDDIEEMATVYRSAH